MPQCSRPDPKSLPSLTIFYPEEYVYFPYDYRKPIINKLELVNLEDPNAIDKQILANLPYYIQPIDGYGEFDEFIRNFGTHNRVLYFGNNHDGKIFWDRLLQVSQNRNLVQNLPRLGGEQKLRKLPQKFIGI